MDGASNQQVIQQNKVISGQSKIRGQTSSKVVITDEDAFKSNKIDQIDLIALCSLYRLSL